MTFLINWVCSAGGPLIVAPAEIATHWRGVEGWSPSEDWREVTDESASDYARACGIDAYLGTLAVGPGRALILGDEPMQTAFIPRPEGGILVRWMYAENEGSVRRAVGVIPESIWEPTPHQIEVAQEGILIFDSGCSGDDLTPPEGGLAPAPWIRIELPSDTYLVDTADYKPDDSTRLILHRLRRRHTGLADQTLPSG